MAARLAKGDREKSWVIDREVEVEEEGLGLGGYWDSATMEVMAESTSTAC